MSDEGLFLMITAALVAGALFIGPPLLWAAMLWFKFWLQ
jgi:hypothetical protein